MAARARRRRLGIIIRFQCNRAQYPRGSDKWREGRKENAELLQKVRKSILSPLPEHILKGNPEIRRGFVDTVKISASTFRKLTKDTWENDWLAHAPIAKVVVTGMRVNESFNNVEMALKKAKHLGVKRLGMRFAPDAYILQEALEQHIHSIANSTYTRNLTELDLSHNLQFAHISGDAEHTNEVQQLMFGGLSRLFDSPHIKNIKTLDLSYNGLRYNEGTHWLNTLTSSPYLKQLESLDVSHNQLSTSECSHILGFHATIERPMGDYNLHNLKYVDFSFNGDTNLHAHQLDHQSLQGLLSRYPKQFPHGICINLHNGLMPDAIEVPPYSPSPEPEASLPEPPPYVINPSSSEASRSFIQEPN